MRPLPPPWLLERLQDAGGSISFRTYMDWALHDPEHGYYGRGLVAIGPRGDFATSPSLGREFSALLLPQLIEWLQQVPGERLSLVEAGPGQGHLACQLLEGLLHHRSELAARLELVLLEPNPGMVERQREALSALFPHGAFPVRWADWEELQRSPLRGVMIAHEVLDALSVDRVLWDGLEWRWQHVACREGQLRLVPGPPLAREIQERLLARIPSAPGREPGWCTEVHSGLAPWFHSCRDALRDGVLLVIDYALEARRYYAPWRPSGTLMAYREQRTIDDPLLEPGSWDLTAHLCLEGVEEAAHDAGWITCGHRRQGEALLALGLAQRLSELSRLPGNDLAMALHRREQLLRLADPLGTGDFRWLVFQRTDPHGPPWALTSSCLREPGGMEAPSCL